jgi:hypothetical protein
VPIARRAATAVTLCVGLLLMGCTDPIGTEPANPGGLAALARGTWTTFSGGPVSPRYGEMYLWTNAGLLIWGGVEAPEKPTCPCPSDSLADGAIYNVNTNRWARTARSPLESRTGAAAVWTGRLALIWGGETIRGEGLETGNTTKPLTDGASYDPTTRKWELLPRSPLGPRDNESVFWTGHLAVFLGGFKAVSYPSSDPAPTSYPTELSTGATYDPTTRQWKTLPPLPTRKGGPAAINGIWTGQKLIVWESFISPMGGATLAEAWTPGSARWRALPAPPNTISVTNATATVAIGHRVVLVEGQGEAFRPTTYLALYNTKTEKWSTRTILPKTPGELPGLFASTGSMLVGVGLGEATQGPDGPVYAPSFTMGFDPATGRVRNLPDPPYAVMEGGSPVIAWTGTSLVLWGPATKGNRYVGLKLTPHF